MKRLLISIVVWFALCGLAHAQCPSTNPSTWLYTVDSNNVQHIVACIDPTTGKVIWLNNTTFQGSVQDYSGQVYNVLANGLKNDGVTDSGTACTNLSAAISAAGGGTMYFPPGNYLTTGCSLASSVHVRGAGITATKITVAVGNYGAFWAQGVSNVSFRDMEINGGQSGSAATGGGIFIKGSTNAYVQSVYAHDGGSSNLCVDCAPNIYGASSTIFLEDNVLGPTHNNTVGNIQTGYGTSNFVIKNNVISETQTNQLTVDLFGSSNGVISGNSISGGAAGIQVENGGTDLQIVKNIITGTGIGTGTQAAIMIVSGGSSRTLARIVISHNILDGNYRGITLTSFNGDAACVIRDNIISNNMIYNSLNGSGIKVENPGGATTFTNTLVQNNLIDTFGAADSNAGILFLTATAGNIISGNKVTSGAAATFGLVFGAAIIGAKVSGNDFSGNPGGYISNGSTGVVVIEDSTGLALAGLPSANDGSKFYCNNCNPASSPCTSGGAGAHAFKQGGALKCL